MASIVTNETLRGLDTLPDCALVSDRTIAALTEASRATIWRWSREGRLPPPVKLGPNLTRWQVGPLRAALAKLAEGEVAA